MKVLVLETASSPAFVAAVEVESGGTTVLALVDIEEPRALARTLMGSIDAVLVKAGWRVAALDLIAAATGPGSWTSLRVGLTTAKTLAQVLGTPLIGVPNFEALAAAVAASTATASEGSTQSDMSPAGLLVLAPCRPGELYGACYRLSEGGATAMAPLTIDGAAQHLERVPGTLRGQLLLLAPGFPNGEPQELAQVPIVEVEAEALARELARCGAGRLHTGEADDFLTLVPLCLAPSNAERVWLARS